MAKVIIVNLAEQVLEAHNGSHRVYLFDCVTGAEDHPTPRGTFHILRKQHPCRSRTYDVEMDYAMFFTTRGHAIHQYHGVGGLGIDRFFRQAVSDYFGSHGCVRLSEDDARQLYRWTPVTTRVRIL